jgi:energy-coupling factor transporter ATP-binding protein EcfA2
MGGQLARGFCLMQTLEQADVAAPALPRRAYPGLRPFTLDEDLVFFGREPMIDDIIDLLAKRCLILVHGSSGSGKSSLILAGVLPRLARQHRRHGWRWRTASVRPGGGPLWNLAHALAELEGGTPSAARVNELRLSFDRTGADLTQIVTHLAGMEQERLCPWSISSKNCSATRVRPAARNPASSSISSRPC